MFLGVFSFYVSQVFKGHTALESFFSDALLGFRIPELVFKKLCVAYLCLMSIIKLAQSK